MLVPLYETVQKIHDLKKASVEKIQGDIRRYPKHRQNGTITKCS